MTMTTPRSSAPQDDEVDTILALLGAHVPLTLLLDLATPVHSVEMYQAETGDAGWLVA
jgi:hypothetical protein